MSPAMWSMRTGWSERIGRIQSAAAGAWIIMGAGLILVSACRPTEEDALRHPRNLGLPEAGFERPDPFGLQHSLDNGLMSYVVEDHTVPLVTVTALVGAGTASDAREGAAEALAAILRDRGPATRSAGDFRSALERMVAAFDVTQSAEETTVSIEVPSEDWQEALGLLADVVVTPAISDADARSAMSGVESHTTDSGEMRSYEGSLQSAVALMERHVFEGHPFGRTPTPAEAATLNAVAVRTFHRDHFVPGNAVVTIAGAVDADAARDALSDAFGAWEAAPVPAGSGFPPAEGNGSRDVLAYEADKLQAWVVIGHDLPQVPLEDEAALLVMNYILGGGHFDTRLFRATRDRRGLTNDASGFLAPSVRGPGTYTVRTYGRPAVVPLLVQLTLDEIDRIRSEPVTEEELFVAKGALADGEFTLGYRTGTATARTLATEWLRYGDHDRSASFQDRVRSVTTDDVLDVARRYLRPDELDLVVLGPLDAVMAAPILEGEPPLEAFGVLDRR